MNHTILHMDLDTFYVSVERLLDTRLVKKPILIGVDGESLAVGALEAYELMVVDHRSSLHGAQLLPDAMERLATA